LIVFEELNDDNAQFSKLVMYEDGSRDLDGYASRRSIHGGDDDTRMVLSERERRLGINDEQIEEE
jgi:hypothetical protein